MIAALCAVLWACLAGYAVPRDAAPATIRLARLLGAERPARRDRGDAVGRWAFRCGAALSIGGFCAVMGGTTAGVATGVVAGILFALLPAHGDSERGRRLRVMADLPVTVDLLGACLRAGTPWADSAEAVGKAVGGPLGAELCGVAAQVRLGADPHQVWLSLGRQPELLPLARVFGRAISSGAPLTAGLGRLSGDQRRHARTVALARARAAGVRAVAPLGLCFLPACLLLGIVPAIVGVAGTVNVP